VAVACYWPAVGCRGVVGDDEWICDAEGVVQLRSQWQKCIKVSKSIQRNQDLSMSYRKDRIRSRGVRFTETWQPVSDGARTAFSLGDQDLRLQSSTEVIVSIGDH